MRAEAPTSSSKPTNVKAMIDDIAESLRRTAEEVVPWFIEQMPEVYFLDTDEDTRMAHLKAIIAARAGGRPIDQTLRSEDGMHWTTLRPLDYPGVLASVAEELPRDRKLRSAKIHTAGDGTLVLDTFEFGDPPPFDPDDPKQAAIVQETIVYAATDSPDISEAEIRTHFRRCTADYVNAVTPLRFIRHYEHYLNLSGTDGTDISLDAESDPTQSRITISYGNATTQVMLARIATRLARSEINIHRAYVDNVSDDVNGTISLLGFVVTGPDGGPLEATSEVWTSIRQDLLRNKWIDNRTLNLAYAYAELSVTKAEIITGLCDLIHQVLVKRNPYAFNADRILSLAERELPHVIGIVDLFLERFNPDDPADDAAFAKRTEMLNEQIQNNVDLEDARTVLDMLVKAVHAVHRTNVYVEERYALSMRLDPRFLTTDDRPEWPFGVFYVHGRSFNGFHVRFRDIARGGVRVIKPLGADQHAREMDRHYDEVYQLAYAQQLKNKDIPEGGAKAVILLEPDARLSRSVKGFVDSILDLITPDPETKSRIVDRDGVPELLYLGPDENMTPHLIVWIVDRARRRGYPTPNALMSSKPGAGINHKDYGVTSEGVTVFLDAALREVGIDPRTQPFTVKITGGPDGDVAGNEIRILDREYGNNARIVGIADGSGSGEDPDGLDHEELMRLFTRSEPIAAFDKSKLGPRGRITALDDPEGVQLRNSLHNRVVADAFVPAGGRPSAIHGGNWRDYLGKDGVPSSKVIVEGANLFLTPEARHHLSDAGVLIVKDSSANKCGVICSSYEIVASMLLPEQEFLANKETFVDQVLGKLRALARREADLLMRLHRNHPQVPLPEMSVRLSQIMIRTADAIESAIDRLDDADRALFDELVIDHLPPVLIELAGDRLWTDTPRPYLKWIMAKSLSARIVYRDGFEALEAMPLDAIADLAIQYLRMDLERRKLAATVLESNLPDRERIAVLLAKAGVFSTLGSE